MPVPSFEMNPLWLLTGCWVLSASLAGFALMGIDKSRARRRERRVRERTFYRVAAAGGAFGIVVGISFFRHKTLKDSFTIVAYTAAVGWILALLWLQRLLGSPAG
jgi:uncharacterized membrane protein YsdA (DUF1294 family)